VVRTAADQAGAVRNRSLRDAMLFFFLFVVASYSMMESRGKG
jgi:hypothetical protein